MTELGNRLREAREAKGLSLEDLQSITKIQKRYLTGIEEGNYAPMPGDFYVRAFIKQYCEAVDLEPEEIFNEYVSDIPATHHEDLPEKLSRVSTRKTVSHSSGSKIFEIIPKIIVGLFVFGAVFAIWYIVQKNAADNSNVDPVNQDGNDTANLTEQEGLVDGDDPEDSVDTPDDDTDSELVEEDPEPALEVVGVEGITTTYKLTNADTFNVVFSSNGESWLVVDGEDGTQYYYGALTEAEGEQAFDVTLNSPISIVVGRATELQITVNGIPLEYEIPAAEKVRQDIIIEFEQTIE